MWDVADWHDEANKLRLIQRFVSKSQEEIETFQCAP